MAWTSEMIDKLRQMWKQGLTTSEIAKKIGVSKNSIVGKVHRLNLTARPSPIKKKEDLALEQPAQKNVEKAAKHTKSVKKVKIEPVEISPTVVMPTPVEPLKAVREW